MIVNAATENAFERIAQRAGDVQRAFTPGAIPQFSDAGTPASSQFSLDPLSAAPPDDAYFVTTDERGRTSYTQNGSFTVRDGTLVDENGDAVMGFTADTSPLGKLRYDDVDSKLGRVQNLRVEADGTLAYDRRAIDPRIGAVRTERVLVGRIALARFPAGTRLNLRTGDRYVASSEVAPHVGRPGDGNFARVQPMRRENSRIDFDRSLDRLEDAYVTFDALQAAHSAQSSLNKSSMDLLK